uniref:DNA mismatch repair protein n=1 Tax=Eptatretus burgeri TaxID=7764 RepID=A0A8C4PYB2_EPTBU
MQGHPWWPSMVCSHPVSGSHIRVRDKQQEIHVHFFGDPVTRGWVLSNACKPYGGSTIRSARKGGLFFSTAPGMQQSLKQADSAMSLPRKKRFEIPVSTKSSDDDESGEDDDREEGSSLGNGTKEDDDCNGLAMEVDGETVITEGKHENENDGKGLISQRVKRSKRHTSPQVRDNQHTKRRRLIDSCSESDGNEESADDFKPGEENAESSSESDSHSEVEENSPNEESEPDMPVKVKGKQRKASFGASKVSGGGDQVPGQSLKMQRSPCTSHQPNKANNTPLKPGAMDTKEKGNTTVTDGGRDDHKIWNHETLDWLKEDKRMDAKRHKSNHPDFDPTTLYIPERYIHECTPGVKRWWEIKATMFDTIIFFKVGKFYELYHMDAVVGVEELGLLFMKGSWAHSGFPEASLARYAAGLVQKGFKVARVEQTETPEMMEARCRNMARAPSKFDKVVRREVCRIITKGTQTCSVVDGTLGESDSHFLLAVKEKELSVDTGENCQEEPAVRRFGICFVDASIGRFCLGEFADDRHCSRFRTLIAHHVPVQVLIERGSLSTEVQKIIRVTLASALQEQLVPGSQFWDASKTLKILAEEEYFGKEKIEAGDARPGGLPPVLQEMTAGTDALGLSAAEDCELMLSALGACFFYLRKCLVDRELISMGNFERYVPPDIASCRDGSDSNPSQLFGRQMILDGLTLANLEVLRNSTTGTTEATLLERLDSCATPFGKRLLRQWLVAPLCHPKSINDRLDALEDLMAISEQVTKVKELLRKLPDLERLLSKIHSIGLRPRGGSSDPDSRAIFYEEREYSRRKIADFLATIDGFQTAQKAVYTLKDCLSGFKSRLLRRVAAEAGEESDGLFPELTDDLKYWNTAFDHTKAHSRGDIEPKPGFDPEYDQALADIKDITQNLMDYLERQGKRIGCRKLRYWGTGRNRFQLEVPDGALVDSVPNEYQLKTTKKGCKRYWTPEIERLLGKLTAAEDRRTALQNDCLRRLFSHFDSSYQRWIAAVECVSVLDVLLSLANYSESGGMVGGSMCRPTVKLSKKRMPWLELRESRHPCVFRGAFGDDFIPNDILIGVEDADEGLSPARCVLVTGPNMGGKSTLMRQAGLTIVLAQLGCFVPAESCFLSPVDRVFTRLGASDRIMSGESTFFVELSETSSILRHATTHSLVLLDELGKWLCNVNISLLERMMPTDEIPDPNDGFIFAEGSLVNVVEHSCELKSSVVALFGVCREIEPFMLSASDFVLFDAAGRGTATYDGTAIASAVVHELAQNIGCRTLFSTHYHSLVEDFAKSTSVRLGHMACMVENENDDDPSQETITFLYKFVGGACPKSYGFNAARLAGLPDEVIKQGHRKAQEFERSTNALRAFRKLFTMPRKKICAKSVAKLLKLVSEP